MTRTVTVTRLSSFPTNGSGCKWWIYIQGSTQPITTFNEWVASLAQRSIALKRPVTVGLRDTRWGSEIVTIELAPEAQQEGAA